MRKILIIGLLVIAFAFLNSTSALASSRHSGRHFSYSKIEKSETRSWNQGKAQSDPDDNGKGPDRSNLGFDKPGYSGGINDDRDGNNGCGNDSDREDDNEGWCGHKAKKDKENKEDKKENKACTEKAKDKPEPKTTSDPKPEPKTEPKTPRTEKGTVLSATTLPKTGIVEDLSLPALLVAGWGLIAAGLVLMAASVVYKKTFSKKA
ncbi:MAG: hypothetical protein Q8P13_02695 [bacterium]|nr:hypothetical protein [bacterium]